MGFGEEYQGMTDREILIDMAGDIKALKERPPCPSPQCKEHDKRITMLEQAEQTRSEDRNNTVAYIALGVSVVVMLLEIAALVVR